MCASTAGRSFSTLGARPTNRTNIVEWERFAFEPKNQRTTSWKVRACARPSRRTFYVRRKTHTATSITHLTAQAAAIAPPTGSVMRQSHAIMPIAYSVSPMSAPQTTHGCGLPSLSSQPLSHAMIAAVAVTSSGITEKNAHPATPNSGLRMRCHKVSPVEPADAGDGSAASCVL